MIFTTQKKLSKVIIKWQKHLNLAMWLFLSIIITSLTLSDILRIIKLSYYVFDNLTQVNSYSFTASFHEYIFFYWYAINQLLLMYYMLNCSMQKTFLLYVYSEKWRIIDPIVVSPVITNLFELLLKQTYYICNFIFKD